MSAIPNPNNSSFPSLSDYQGALQNPKLCFRAKDLKVCEIKKEDNSPLPEMASGSFAGVCKATLSNGKAEALRFFHTRSEEAEKRLPQISDAVASYKIGWLVNLTYVKKGIHQNGSWYPLVRMEWVEGVSLFAWVQDQVKKNAASEIRRCADRFEEMIRGLSEKQIAHGDLQHDNIKVTPSGELQLIDYDDMCVPGLEGQLAGGLGKPPYQHPRRCDDNTLSPSLDNFSAIFIYLALRAVAADQSLWGKYVVNRDYDNLLIREDDLESPTSGLFADLRNCSDPDVSRISKQLVDAFRGQYAAVPTLEEVVFSADQIQALVDQKKWREVVELTANIPGWEARVSTDLKHAIQDAYKRVECHDQLLALIRAGDEQGMVGLLNQSRHLLVDFPEASNDLSFADRAEQSLACYSQMQKLEAQSNWVDYVGHWESNLSLLSGRRSAARVEELVQQWRPRNAALAAVIHSLAPPIDTIAVKKAWNALEELGGHTQSAEHAQEISVIIACADVWPRVETLIADSAKKPFGYDRDKALVDIWDDNQSVLKSWSVSSAMQGIVETARDRSVVVDRFKSCAKTLASTNTIRDLKAAATIGNRIDPTYEHPWSDLANKIRLQDDAISALQLSLSSNSTAETICLTWRKVKGIGAERLIPDDLMHQLSAFEKVSKISLRRSVLDLDEQIVRDWDPILRDWGPAKNWQARYDEAVARNGILDNLRRAVANQDDVEALRLSESPCLTGYPISSDLQSYLQSARKRAKQADELIEAIQSGVAKRFRETFNLEVIHQYEQRFCAVRKALVDLVESELRNPEEIGLVPPLVVQGVTRIDGVPRATWNWPDSRFTTQCKIGISKYRPNGSSSPSPSKFARVYDVDKRSFEDAGGGVTLDARLRGMHVCVWAVFDLGFEELNSQPLYIGSL